MIGSSSCFRSLSLANQRYSPTLIRLNLSEMVLTENQTPSVEVSSPKKFKPFVVEASNPFMSIAVVHPEARLPVYGSSKAAGMDLHACEEVAVPAKGKSLVNTGLKLAIPTGYYGRVAPRSGLAVKNFIDVGAGVIDEDYRGVLKVLLFNFGEVDFKVNVGDRIAQLLIEKVLHIELVQVEESNLDSTKRGVGGFGSTGIQSL